MSTQQDYRITVVVDDEPIGAFDSRNGGDTDSDISTRETAEGLEIFPSTPTTGEVTVSRIYKRDRDHELMRRLRKRAGRAKMTISEQPLDVDKNAWGKPVVWTGLLKAVNPGDSDAASKEPRDLELVMTALDVA